MHTLNQLAACTCGANLLLILNPWSNISYLFAITYEREFTRPGSLQIAAQFFSLNVLPSGQLRLVRSDQSSLRPVSNRRRLTESAGLVVSHDEHVARC